MTTPQRTPGAHRPLIWLMAFILCCLPALTAHPQSPSPASSTQETALTLHATGTFEVKLDPQPADERSGGPSISRMLIDKHFHGDIEATSKGVMLAAGNPARGNAGYVAIELVTGSLKGHTGTFALQHTGTITGGAQQLTITVVPGSATGQLTGLTGTMDIVINQGQHSWKFDYALPPTP